ncbi:hypothetical protein MZD04_gp363 [Pseudomonas phage Psa21]|uniref:Uncharacterized protein n=1 Tax=Pseudomonas phage Psa21 TaxID=2530023 RepID=A0A481W4U2_9CAUD|nr:hypothetical protein MZD04_gp363 [Pseudomonas phage Psa21]QBJ02889.1 hypothetical protein PSA21_363 [Pseudomonas phage Psa21]
MSVKLIKRGNAWVTEFLGKERHFIVDSDLVTWRSLGVLTGAAVEFSIDLGGSLEHVRNLLTGEELSELEIPSGHTVARMIKATKLYVNGDSHA